jgi:1-acyl-sn-glycerol-3-phosphate acyltransferase
VLLYRFLWLSLKLVYRAFFRRIYISHNEKLPRDRPVILATNHPNSFLDSVIFPVYLLKQQYFLARGDAWANPTVGRILGWLNMIPIYRRSDAKGNSEKNIQTFDRVADLLNKDQIVLIFSEGICVVEKRMRPLMKGTARMAFHAAEKYGWDRGVVIQTAGVNYTHPDDIRGEVLFNFGDQIEVSKYEDLYRENPNQAVVELTEEVAKGMIGQIIHVNEENEDLFEFIVYALRNDQKYPKFPFVEYNNYSRFQMEKGLANKLNELQEKQENEWTELKQKVNTLKHDMDQAGINDLPLSKSASTPFWQLALFAIFLPLSILSYAMHAWVFKLARKYSRRIIKSNVFHTSFFVGFIMVPMWFVSLIPFLLFWIFGNIYWALGWLAFQWIGGYIAVHSLDLWNKIKLRSKGEVLRKRQPDVFDDLYSRRQALIEEFKS